MKRLGIVSAAVISVVVLATPASIQILLDASADAKAKSEQGKTPWSFA